MHRPFQTAELGIVETVYKVLATVEQNDWEFVTPGDSETYTDLDIKIYDVDLTDTTAVTNNILHSLFIQCTVTYKGVPVTQSHEHYNCRAYLETLLNYGTDGASSHLSNSY